MGSREQGNEYLYFIKGGEFLNKSSDCHLLQRTMFLGVRILGGGGVSYRANKTEVSR